MAHSEFQSTAEGRTRKHNLMYLAPMYAYMCRRSATRLRRKCLSSWKKLKAALCCIESWKINKQEESEERCDNSVADYSKVEAMSRTVGFKMTRRNGREKRRTVRTNYELEGAVYSLAFPIGQDKPFNIAILTFLPTLRHTSIKPTWPLALCCSDCEEKCL